MSKVKLWPRLSQTLTGPRELGCCQSCGTRDGEMTLWMEHDEQDRPEPIVVSLCTRCSDALIEKHPRLYRDMEPNEPMPGAMPLCVGCAHQASLGCRNPVAKINGGPGLRMTYPRPTLVHLDGRTKGGKRFGRTHYLYPGPVSLCAGKEAKTDA